MSEKSFLEKHFDQKYVGYFIRVGQIAFATTSLGLSGKFVSDVGNAYGKVVYTIVISSLTLVYLGAIIAGHKFIPVTAIFLGDSLMIFLWLVSWILSANTFASYKCYSDNDLGYIPFYCSRVRAQFIIGIMIFIGFVLSATVLIAFTLAPAEDNIVILGYDAMFNRHTPIELVDNVSNEVNEDINTVTPEEKES